MSVSSSNKKVQHFTPDLKSTKGEGLTKEVAEFVLSTEWNSLPEELISIGKK